jgi:hypothetical protein
MDQIPWSSTWSASYLNIASSAAPRFRQDLTFPYASSAQASGLYANIANPFPGAVCTVLAYVKLGTAQLFSMQIAGTAVAQTFTNLSTNEYRRVALQFTAAAAATPLAWLSTLAPQRVA